jgi:bifunctional DNA-binding transcriptional regulator/antitoxin component of YhaV-PrlF toxin-antitoxin module
MATFAHHLWTDGRSGRLGQLVGDIVLAELENRFGPVSRRKGTIFQTASELLIGRLCATDRYLVYPEIHWSTFDPGQERQLRAHPELADRKFYYLFITGRPHDRAIVYWLIPARVLITGIAELRPRRDGAINVRIREDRDKSILNGADVTRYCHRIDLNAAQQAEIETTESLSIEDPTQSRFVSLKAQNKKTSPQTNSAVLPGAYTPLAQASTVVIGRDGTLLLPAGLRRQFSLAEGTRAIAYHDGQRIILQPVRPQEYRTARGAIKGTGAFKALIEERKREREL